MRPDRFGHLLKEGFKSIFTHGFMSFACIVVIVACLLIMGNFALLSMNIDYNIKQLEAENEILAYIDDSLSEEAARDLQAQIRSLDNVSNAEFVTRDQAMENFLAKYDDEDREMFSEVTPSWFRHRYVIYMEDLTLLSETTAAISAIEGVADVSASLELAQGLITVRNIVSMVSVVLIVILFVVSVFIMQNTIKLATFSRREEIAIMKMVGASNGFIRWPFIIEGLILGLTGGVLAFGIQWLIYDALTERMLRSFGTVLHVIPFNTLRLPLGAVFLAVGLVVGTFGSNIAIRNYLKV